MPTVNALAHVTVGISSIGKPKDSNEIVDWTPVVLEEEEGEAQGEPKAEGGGEVILRRLKLTGIIKEWQSVGLAKPVPVPRATELKVNFGKLLKQYHPTITGPQIGKAVKEIKEWAEQNGATSEAQIEEYIKTYTPS